MTSPSDSLAERKLTVSITGATGFIGWHLAETFRDRGWRVRGVVRPGSARPLPAGIERAVTPLDAGGLADAVAGSAVVVHGAGVIRARNRRIFEEVNVAGTRAAVRAANAANARFVYISSQAAAGSGTLERPSGEALEPRPLNAYGRSKLAAELIVGSEARVPWTIVRPSAVYGPRDRGFLPLFRFASRGLFPMVARATTAFTLIHVDDLVRGILLAAQEDRASGQTIFFGHAHPQTTDQILRGLAHAYGRSYRPLLVPAPLVAAAACAGELSWLLRLQPAVDLSRLRELTAEGFVCSVDRARDVLGFTAAIDWLEGAERTAGWYRRHGWT